VIVIKTYIDIKLVIYYTFKHTKYFRPSVICIKVGFHPKNIIALKAIHLSAILYF